METAKTLKPACSCIHCFSWTLFLPWKHTNWHRAKACLFHLHLKSKQKCNYLFGNLAFLIAFFSSYVNQPFKNHKINHLPLLKLLGQTQRWVLPREWSIPVNISNDCNKPVQHWPGESQVPVSWLSVRVPRHQLQHEREEAAGWWLVEATAF